MGIEAERFLLTQQINGIRKSYYISLPAEDRFPSDFNHKNLCFVHEAKTK